MHNSYLQADVDQQPCGLIKAYLLHLRNHTEMTNRAKINVTVEWTEANKHDSEVLLVRNEIALL